MSLTQSDAIREVLTRLDVPTALQAELQMMEALEQHAPLQEEYCPSAEDWRGLGRVLPRSRGQQFLVLAPRREEWCLMTDELANAISKLRREPNIAVAQMLESGSAWYRARKARQVDALNLQIQALCRKVRSVVVQATERAA